MKADLSKVTKANIDICTVCNHTCVFCPNQDARTPKNIMPAENFRKVMADLTVHAKLDELGLSAKGEPLLNPQLGDIVRIAKKEFKIPYVYISTNGSLLSRSILVALLEAGLDSIKFSINAFDRDSYKEIHGKDHFDRVMINLGHAVDLLDDYDFNLLTSSVTDLPEDEIRNRYREHIGDRTDAIKFILRYNTDFRPHEESQREQGLDYPACPYLFNEIYIDSNCDLRACCIDYFNVLNFGSLLDTPIEKVWHSPKFDALRKSHIDKRLPGNHLCYRCLTFEQDMFENEKHIDEILKGKRDK